LALHRAGGSIVLVDPEMGNENFMSRVKFSQAKWILQDRIIEKIEKFSFLKPFLRCFHIWFPEHLSIENRITIEPSFLYSKTFFFSKHKGSVSP
jgi:hypothetical protein